MVQDFSFPKTTPWLQRIWWDLQPTPGRLGKALRMTFASVLVLVLMLALQMPYVAYGLYALFLIGRQSPSVSLRSGIFTVVTMSLVVAAELSVVILSDNDPMARLLSIAVGTFLAGMVVVCTSQPQLGSTWGLFYCVVIGYWERHAPAGTLVNNSLRLLAAFAIASACGIAVEYVFGGRSPVVELENQFSIRYRALEEMFTLYARQSSPQERLGAAIRVSRLAAAGQREMIDLYYQIADRGFDTGTLPIGTRVHITMLAELMEDSAAFGLQSGTLADPESRGRCKVIAEQCDRLVRHTAAASVDLQPPGLPAANGLLNYVETTIHSILVMPIERDAAKNKELSVLPSKDVPFLIPGGIRDKDNIAFALKISLCTTLCYIAYNAIDWQGLSTSVSTVMVTGLSTTAAMKQRLTLRLLGSLVGGLVLGLGATAFLFPYMDSITSLVLLIAPIVFAASWIWGGSRFNFIGLQIAFGFYLVALVDFAAPTELAPARDRFIGIIFALVVMWFVFDQLWPIRTVTAMRRVLASVLRSGASLFLLINNLNDQDQFARELEGLRDRLGKSVSTLRTMSETVEFEFGDERERQVRSSKVILQISTSAAALIWNQVASLHEKRDHDFRTEPSLVEMRSKLADHLRVMADCIARKAGFPPEQSLEFPNVSSTNRERYEEYSRNTISRYRDLQTLASTLSHEA